MENSIESIVEQERLKGWFISFDSTPEGWIDLSHEMWRGHRPGEYPAADYHGPDADGGVGAGGEGER